MMLSGVNKAMLFWLMPLFILASCSRQKHIFQSSCNDQTTYKRVEFTELVNHIEKYDKQYIEVAGKYKEGFEQSALVNGKMFASHDLSKSLWVDFSQDCPLLLAGTQTGLFTYNNGQFTQMNNRQITIRGKIDIRDKGHLNQYKGTIDRVSFIEL